MKKIFSDFNPFFLKILNLNKRLEFLNFKYKRILFLNSLSFEDSFLFFFLNLKKIFFNSYFIDTGKSYKNFVNFLNKLNSVFFNNISTIFPDHFLNYKYISKYNFNSFYNNILLRKLCCYIRKIEPYNKILLKKDFLITGKRLNRINNNNLSIEYDFNRNIIKYNFLYNWDFKDIFYFLEKFNIKINYIHNYGFISLGCHPCTRRPFNYQTGRSGRWWWEKNSLKECGLHL